MATENKLLTLRDMLQGVYYTENLETNCCRQCSCCRVAMPQIKYSEAVNIIDLIWNSWSKEDKAQLLTTCVRYFFSKSLIKPCPLLSGVYCRIYDDRPISCRLYGLWPKDAWNKRVERFEQALGLPKEQIPLNTQCPVVRRKKVPCPDCSGKGCEACSNKGEIRPPDLTEEQIQKLYDALDVLDLKMGVKQEQLDKNWNTRTLHDWILYRFFGEGMLSRMSAVVMGNNEAAISATMDVMESTIRESFNGKPG